MNTKELKPTIRNYLIKDLMTPKYRMRVASNIKRYNRKIDKQTIKKELSYG